MLHRAHALSSTTEAFNEECAKLRSIFSRLNYPIGLVNSTINMWNVVYIFFNRFFKDFLNVFKKRFLAIFYS